MMTAVDISEEMRHARLKGLSTLTLKVKIGTTTWS